MKDLDILKSICYLCENDEKCKYQYFIEQGKVCPYFNPKYNCDACDIKCGDNLLCFKFDPKKNIIDKVKKHPIEDKVKKLLIDLMQMEKSTEDALVKFKQFLESNGIKADLLDVRLMGYINNLIALNTLDHLIEFYGMKDFREKIICMEIDRIFNPERKKEQVSH